jgi:hypothetical protein
MEVVRFSNEQGIHANPDGRRSRNILAPLQIFQMDLTRIFFPAVYVLTAMVIHALFHPALINSDGIDIYSQATSKIYNDWHPPIMAITLSGFLEAGSSFDVLMFFQCLLGCLGFRSFCLAVQAVGGDKLVSIGSREVIAFLIFMVLLSPLFPFLFYLMTFGKDSWYAISLFWISAVTIKLYKDAPQISFPRMLVRMTALAVLMAFSVLIRHNALLTLPILVWILWRIIVRANIRYAIIIASLPFWIFLSLHSFQNTFFQVKSVHTESSIMILDLVGLCVQNQQVCRELPYIHQYLQDGYAERYRFGNVRPIYWKTQSVVSPFVLSGEAYPKLKGEYLNAIMKFPFTFVWVKLRAFKTLLGLHHTHEWFQRDIYPNPFGLVLNKQYQSVRDCLIVMGEKVSDHPILRLISGVHLIWIGIGGAWLILFLYRSSGQGAVNSFMATLLLLPLSYYGSFLFSTPTWDFRLMFPATLLVEVFTITFLFHKMFAPLINRRGKWREAKGQH